MKAVVSLFVVLMVAFTFSCASTVLEGRKIDAEKVKKIETGATNVNELVKLVGTPTKVEKQPNGDLVYFYNYKAVAPRLLAKDTTTNQILEVTLRQGVVKDYKFRQYGEEALLRRD